MLPSHRQQHLCFPKPTTLVILEIGSVSLVGIVLIGALIVLIIHVLSMLSSTLLCLIRVILVHALGLGELVNLTSNEASEKLLGELMGDCLSWNIG